MIKIKDPNFPRKGKNLNKQNMPIITLPELEKPLHLLIFQGQTNQTPVTHHYPTIIR